MEKLIKYMKSKIYKLSIIVYLILILSACTDNGSGNAITGETEYTTIIIDNCEYLKKYEGYQCGYTFSHKGNCKNPIHYQIIHDTIYYKIQ